MIYVAPVKEVERVKGPEVRRIRHEEVVLRPVEISFEKPSEIIVLPKGFIFDFPLDVDADILLKKLIRD